MSMNNSTTKKTEEQQREQRAAELRELRASIADGSEAKKKLLFRRIGPPTPAPN